MDINELKLYTKNLDTYTVDEVLELEPMTDLELELYQYEIEYATGNTSDWDRVRALITFKKRIFELEMELEKQKEWSKKHMNKVTLMVKMIITNKF